MLLRLELWRIKARWLLSGASEKMVRRTLRDLVTQGMLVVDAGASYGRHTITMAGLVGGEGWVFSFEPEPHSFEMLARRIKLGGYSNVTAVRKALSNNNGKATLFVPRNKLTQSHLVSSGEFIGGEYIEVETQTLDDFLQGLVPDVVKMDVEGAEPLVLEGMANTIRNSTSLKIITELNPKRLKWLGNSAEEYLNMLLSYGFSIYNLNEDEKRVEEVRSFSALIEYATLNGMTNLLAVK